MKTRVLPSILFLSCLAWLPANSQEWQPLAQGLLPSGYTIYGLSVVDENVIWAVAVKVEHPLDEPIKILKTIDGGQVWSVYDMENSIHTLCFDIQAIDEDAAWISVSNYSDGLGPGLFKTEDGGMTWEEKLAHPAGGRFVRILPNGDIYCQNSKYVARSEDNGITWTFDTINIFLPLEGTVSNSGANMAAVVGDTLWVGTSKGRVCRATNYGQNFELFEVGTGNDFEIISIAFSDHLNGMLYAVGYFYEFLLLSTTDGGSTWQPANSQPDYGQLSAGFSVYNIAEVPGLPKAFVLVHDSYTTQFNNEVISYYTTDLGETLTPIPPFVGRSNAVEFISPSTGWLTGGFIWNENSPSFYKWGGGELTPVRELTMNELVLSPNPVTGFLNISLPGSTAGLLEATLFDCYGKQVMQQTVTDRQMIDLHGLVPGLYSVRVVDGGRSFIGRIVKQ